MKRRFPWIVDPGVYRRAESSSWPSPAYRDPPAPRSLLERLKLAIGANMMSQRWKRESIAPEALALLPEGASPPPEEELIRLARTFWRPEKPPAGAEGDGDPLAFPGHLWPAEVATRTFDGPSHPGSSRQRPRSRLRALRSPSPRAPSRRSRSGLRGPIARGRSLPRPRRGRRTSAKERPSPPSRS